MYGLKVHLILLFMEELMQCPKCGSDQIEQRGETWSAEEEDQFKQPYRDQFEKQGHPYYASARLWDDGVIDPAESRHVLGLSLAAALNAPIETTQFGVFRM